MKFVLAIISLLFISFPNLEGQNLLFNWTKSGLKIRNNPTVNGKIIGLIPFGGRMNLESDLDREYPHIEIFEYSNNGCSPSKLELSGYWVKINHNNRIGYVWDGYLSRLPAIEWRDNDFAKHLKDYFAEIVKMEHLDEEIREMQFEVLESKAEGESRIFKIQLSAISMNEAFLLTNIIGGILDSFDLDDYPFCFNGNRINSLEFDSNQQEILIEQ